MFWLVFMFVGWRIRGRTAVCFFPEEKVAIGTALAAADMYGAPKSVNAQGY